MEAPTDPSAVSTTAHGTPFFSSSSRSRSAALLTGSLVATGFLGSRITQARPSPATKVFRKSPHAAAPPANFKKSLRAMSGFISQALLCSRIRKNNGLLCLLISAGANSFDNRRHVFLPKSLLLGFAEELFCRSRHREVNSLAGGCSIGITKILGHQPQQEIYLISASGHAVGHRCEDR